jgi:hypothetical protein
MGVGGAFIKIIAKSILEVNMKIIAEDIYAIQDIIWWIKGYVARVKLQGEIESDFGETHIEALRKAIYLMQQYKEDNNG